MNDEVEEINPELRFKYSKDPDPACTYKLNFKFTYRVYMFRTS